MPRPPTPNPLPVLGIMNMTGFGFRPHRELEWQWCQIVMRNGQFYHSSRNGGSRTTQCREIPHSFPEPFYQVLQARVGDPTTHPPSPPAVSARNWTKYNKSLKDPVRGAGSAQVQIRSYRNRQSGNLARKVRNAFPMCKALRRFTPTTLGDLISHLLHL